MLFHAGTGIDGEVATQFAIATGAILSLHDLSVHTLSADYDPFMEIRESIQPCSLTPIVIEIRESIQPCSLTPVVIEHIRTHYNKQM